MIRAKFRYGAEVMLLLFDVGIVGIFRMVYVRFVHIVYLNGSGIAAVDFFIISGCCTYNF